MLVRVGSSIFGKRESYLMQILALDVVERYWHLLMP